MIATYCATEEKSRGKVCNGQHDQSVHNSVQEAAHLGGVPCGRERGRVRAAGDSLG
jgi:hypothetical protein